MKQVPKPNGRGIAIRISSKVEVTHSVPMMTELDLISSLGGILGLTLGLGFLQMAEMLDWGLAILASRTVKGFQVFLCGQL